MILILVSAVLLFLHLGARPLLSSGEARASQIAIEMLERGDLFIPYLNEELLLTKPPFFHWIIILSYKFFGISEFTSRLPSALAGFFTVILVFLFGRKFWDNRTGLTAGLILSMSPLFFWSARCARIDSLLLLLITLSLYCFWQGRYLAWFLFMGLGVLAKGPVGLIIPLGTAVLFLSAVKKRSLLKSLNWSRGIVVFFAVVLPWFAAIYFLAPQDETKVFFVQQNWAWLTGGGEWFKGYVYIPHLFLGFFPWSLVLFYIWRKREEKTVFLLTWAVLVFFIFFITGKKVSRYILPLYPAVSLLTANVICNKKGANRIFSLATAVVWVFVLLFVNLYPRFLDPELVSIIEKYVNRLFINLIGFLIVMFCFYGAKTKNFTASAAAVFISLIMFIIYFIPIERDYYSPRPFCEMLREEVPEDAGIYAYMSWDNTIRYYFGRHVIVLERKGELPLFLDSKEKAYCIMWERVYNKLPEDIKDRISIIRSGYKVLEHKAMLTANKR